MTYNMMSSVSEGCFFLVCRVARFMQTAVNQELSL